MSPPCEHFILKFKLHYTQIKYKARDLTVLNRSYDCFWKIDIFEIFMQQP